ncbi:MAG: hypothetical protein IPJ48_14875 [Propionivibrio sp.]|uniref:Uncharacterized protein n=1 Tax=Candidatus Propionivibrio dominans TaxID=2954373 RepID=A0A9D7F900_9RHOO|nr:hypothetical protein [Candidatus Propionivibrio dominans]
MAIAKRHGGDLAKLVLRNDDETDDEALAREGLADWPGVVVFLSNADIDL